MHDIILVDEKDREVGTGEKMPVHRKGQLHRAFSVFVFNSTGELMIQRRAKGKYHSAGLWTNTCCSHPKPGEETAAAAHRRLKEEMGFDAALKEVTSFIYKVEFEKDLWEHEYDHVFFGIFDTEPKPDPAEVGEWKWIPIDELERDVRENPQNYTYWFREILAQVLEFRKN